MHVTGRYFVIGWLAIEYVQGVENSSVHGGSSRRFIDYYQFAILMWYDVPDMVNKEFIKNFMSLWDTDLLGRTAH